VQKFCDVHISLGIFNVRRQGHYDGIAYRLDEESRNTYNL
jgi:hypothetical protein